MITAAITLNEKNTAKVDDALDAVQATAKTRKLYARDVLTAVTDTERRLAGIPKALWNGTVVRYDPHTVPGSYSHRAEGTVVTFTRVNTRWVLDTATRATVGSYPGGVRPEGSDLRITLPGTIDRDALLAALLKRKRVTLAPAPQD